MSSPLPATVYATPAPPSLQGGLHDLVARLHPHLHRRQCLVWAVAIVHIATDPLTIASPLQWAPLCQIGTNWVLRCQASSTAPPCPTSHHRLAGIGRWAKRRWRSGSVPCFGRLGRKAPIDRTISAGWAECTMDRARLHSVVYYFPSRFFKSIQFKFKSGLNFRNSLTLDQVQ
jgi:hypothetical protein